MKNILLIINPVSGKLKAREALFDMLETINKHDISPTVRLTSYRGHASVLASEAALSGKYDGIFCCGGDGTLNEVVAGLTEAGSYLPVGYIPAGSTNDFASGLGIPLALTDAAASASEALCRGMYVPLDIGKFGDNRYFSYIASFGAFSSSSYTTPQNVKNVLGHLAYVFEGVKDFFQIKPIHAVCIADGVRYEDDYVFCAATNTYSVGGIVKLNETLVNMSDGEFETVLVKMPRDPAELNHIVNAVIASNLKCDMIEFFRAKELVFMVPPQTQWSLDGEQAAGGAEVTIHNLHNSLSLLKI